MKARPRRVEREVAERLSRFSSKFGFKPVERVPVLGRTGPDITINELGLVIDVKSRLSVPKEYVLGKGEYRIFDYLLGVRLCEIERLFEFVPTPIARVPSIQVARWFRHMDAWRKTYHERGITALVLHRPGMVYDHSTFLIHRNLRRVFYERCTNNGVPASREQ